MFRTKKFDRGAKQWNTYPSHHKTKEASLIEAYEEAIQEAATLSADEDKYGWFEVEMDFEITDSYLCEGLEDISYFPVAVIYYDKAPWDRENDCEIRLMSGYITEAISEAISEDIQLSSPLDKIRAEVKDALRSNYDVMREHRRERAEKNCPKSSFDYIVDGKISALKGIDYLLDELEDEQKSLSDSKLPAEPDRPSIKVFETALYTFIFLDTVDLDKMSKDVVSEWEKTGYKRPYKEIIKEKYGDVMLQVVDRKRVLW